MAFPFFLISVSGVSRNVFRRRARNCFHHIYSNNKILFSLVAFSSYLHNTTFYPVRLQSFLIPCLFKGKVTNLYIPYLLCGLSYDRSTPLPNWVLHTVRSIASCFKFNYFLFSLHSANICLIFFLLSLSLLSFLQHCVLEGSFHATCDPSS